MIKKYTKFFIFNDYLLYFFIYIKLFVCLLHFYYISLFLFTKDINGTLT